MSSLAFVLLAALTLFAAYCYVVTRYRHRQQRQRERQMGLDPLR